MPWPAWWPTIPASAWATTRKTSTRPGWARGGSAPTCAPSGRCSIATGWRACGKRPGWYAGLLGEVRDTEVLMERLEHQARSLPKEDAAAVTPIVARLAKEREAGRKRLLKGMDSPRYIALLDRLTEAAAQPQFASDATSGGPGQAAADALPALVRRPWKRLAKAVRELPEVPADEQLHAVRILAKHTRYAAEAAAGVIGKPATHLRQADRRRPDGPRRPPGRLRDGGLAAPGRRRRPARPGRPCSSAS